MADFPCGNRDHLVIFRSGGYSDTQNVSAPFEISNVQWSLVADLFDPPGRRGPPAAIPRRRMVEAMLFICRTGIQWRNLPEEYGAWTAVWAQWRRWRDSGVWERAMVRLSGAIRGAGGREPTPSFLMIDAQTVKGARYGPTFHDSGGRGGRTWGAKRTVLLDYAGLPFAVRVDPASPHDVRCAKAILAENALRLPRLVRLMADRGYRGLASFADARGVELIVKAPPIPGGFSPIKPLFEVEQAFGWLGRWRRLSRCYEGTTASARAWLAVACVGHLAALAD